MYNVPTDNLREGKRSMIERLRDIYDQHTTAFKLNISLGFILRNIETGEYRYYAPNTNQTMWTLPQFISSRQSLNIVENRLRDTNIIEHLQASKPNSQ